VAESTLSITRTDLRKAVGWFAGYGSDPTGWSDDPQKALTVEEIIKTGERSFYAPAADHQWSFLRPMLTTIVTAAGVGDYDLPDLFAGFVDQLYFSSLDNGLICHLRETGIGDILDRRQQAANNTNGQPQLFAWHPLPQTGETPQRYSLSFWPTPDGVYHPRGQYVVNPYHVTADNPYPMGGQPHAETLREAVLAAAERELNDEVGMHNAEFEKRLQASITHDRRVSTPKFFGYNGDRSGSRRTGPPVIDRSMAPGFVTYNGNSYLGD